MSSIDASSTITRSASSGRSRVALEGAGQGVELEQAMDGLRLARRWPRTAAWRRGRWGRRGAPAASCSARIATIPRTRVVLPVPGPPVITSTRAREAAADRLALLGGERDPLALLEPGERLVDVDLWAAARGWSRRARRRAGEPLLGDRERPGEDRREGRAGLGPAQRLAAAGRRLDRHLGGLRERLEGRLEGRAIDREELCGVGEEPLARQVDVPLVGGGREGVEEPGAHPLRRVGGEAEGAGDPVGAVEADAADLGRARR